MLRDAPVTLEKEFSGCLLASFIKQTTQRLPALYSTTTIYLKLEQDLGYISRKPRTNLSALYMRSMTSLEAFKSWLKLNHFKQPAIRLAWFAKALPPKQIIFSFISVCVPASRNTSLGIKTIVLIVHARRLLHQTDEASLLAPHTNTHTASFQSINLELISLSLAASQGSWLPTLDKPIPLRPRKPATLLWNESRFCMT